MMQPIRAATAPVHATVLVPGSKSMTNRALLLAALAEGVSELSDILISDDTLTFLKALRDLGIMIQLDASTRSCIVAGAGGQFPRKKASVWCNDAATAARFLLPVCAASHGSYQFDGSEQLRQRPLAELLKILRSQGAYVVPEESTEMPFTLIGTERLRGGDIEIESSETGQFVSAMLMVAPFANKPFLIQTKDAVSQPYIEMTCQMMKDFGVMVKRLHAGRFNVPVPQRYHARDYTIEPDFSTASYFFAAAAVTGGTLTIQPVNRHASKQADAEFISILEKMGCEVIENSHGLTVKGPSQLNGVNVDMRNCSDVFMTLAAIAPFAKTPTAITNISHARKKESDRIAVMRSELEKLQIKVEEGKDWLKIYPSVPRPATIESHGDHRIAMAFSVLGLRVEGVEINHADCVKKTCPEFFAMWDEMYSQSI